VGVADTHLLIAQALAGDESSWGALLERLRPRLVLWAASRMSAALRAKVEPEDMAQEILLMAHRSRTGFAGDDPRRFLAWLFRLAENRIRDTVDHFGAVKRQAEPLRPWSQTSPSQAVVREEEIVRVRDALTRLTDDYRRVIQLRRLEERPVPEIAAAMERSENAVRILYCRALRELRRALED
jgi:RNA polymerase sigma-70 factor (ECF subfamily)